MTLDEVRALIGALPETQEESEFSGITWRVRTWLLARVRSGSIMLSDIEFDERDLLVELEPETFHFDPRAAHHMVVWARIATVNPGTLLRLLELRWRRAATKKAIRAYDSG
jgi:hypothetical protein